MPAEAHGHRANEPCDAGLELYARALRQGSAPEAEAAPVACVVRTGLLEPDLEDSGRLRPVTPAFALSRLLRATAERIADERRREERLAKAFEPLLRINGHRTPLESPEVGVLGGTQDINRAITEAMTEACREVLCVQPNTNYANQRGAAAQVMPWTAIRPCSTAAAVSAPFISTRNATCPSCSPVTSSSEATPRHARSTSSPTA